MNCSHCDIMLRFSGQFLVLPVQNFSITVHVFCLRNILHYSYSMYITVSKLSALSQNCIKMSYSGMSENLRKSSTSTSSLLLTLLYIYIYIQILLKMKMFHRKTSGKKSHQIFKVKQF